MRIYVQENTDVYGIVYMLAPLNDTVHVKLIWLPNHLANEANGVCHYEMSFSPKDESKEVRNQWLDGFPEILMNRDGKRNGWQEIPADQNVILIEHDTEWEFEFLIEMVKSNDWGDANDPDFKFDIFKKLGNGVRANVIKSDES